MIELTSSAFEDTVATGTVLVDFWAPWCAPCKALTPLLDDLTSEFEGITFTKVNTQDEPELAAKFQIQSIPAVLIFKDGEVVDQFVGLQSKGAIRETLQKHV